MMFGRKGGEKVLREAMKEKFKLVKKPNVYAISNIYDPIVNIST